jgi:uncharacterized protein YeaO (DUF488 family)
MELVLINGFTVKNLTNENKGILSILIDRLEQADSFIYNFLLDSSNENLAVSDYRVHRLEQYPQQFDEFTEKYSKNQVQALEELFLHPITKQEFLLLTNKIKNGKISLEKLFTEHLKSPRAKMLRLLL